MMFSHLQLLILSKKKEIFATIQSQVYTQDLKKLAKMTWKKPLEWAEKLVDKKK